MNGLTEADLAFIRSSGRDPARVAGQVAALQGRWRPVRLLRPATVGDGIRQLHDRDPLVFRDLHRAAAASGRLSSFVPASGSGTRLFQSLFNVYKRGDRSLDAVRARAAREDVDAADALAIVENLMDLALWPELRRAGVEPAALSDLLDTLFGDRGRRYHELPKGLIPFHRYDGDVRTAFLEHAREAAALGTSADGICRVHFTTSAAHAALFRDEWRRERPRLERTLRTSFRVDFSVQSPATDTIAIDAEGRLIRDESGRIAFRPGGHGALLPNLAACGGDIVLIKNIDNVAREELLEDIVAVRQQICGLLLSVEAAVHDAVHRLNRGGDPAGALDLLRREFGIAPPAAVRSAAEQREFAREQLDRPLRVCGVVRSLVHTGGRPFWMDAAGRGSSLQIVEGAEVNLDDPPAKALFNESIHFNPVDIACSVRDADGVPYDLTAFASPARALIARKVLAGVPALVYEHPGLWNGSMALWNTVFLEIPEFAFNPVKSLSDLLAPGHRPQTR